ncbi:MAG: hypothetical protein KAS32_01415 [Candidatus Peribacteraceae bacterium]|nr:hypothetical protein [Candidatus Peribacteraceae bacterium]
MTDPTQDDAGNSSAGNQSAPPPPPPPTPANSDTPKGPPPVKPGDNVPQGGLDPTQVFASPPPPPPKAQGDDAKNPKDSGPPSPPKAHGLTDEQLKEKGYDEEDIRILKEVGDFRFGDYTSTLTNDNISLPAHAETQFDEQEFLVYLRGSISLTRDEKWRIIQAIPKLSQFQIDELKKILTDEKKKFAELSPKHLLQLQKLEQKHSEDWKDLQSVTVQQGARDEEKQQAEEIRKQLGL